MRLQFANYTLVSFVILYMQYAMLQLIKYKYLRI